MKHLLSGGTMTLKKGLLFLCALIMITGCGKKTSTESEDVSLAKKYARYRVVVYQDQTMKKDLTVLNKTEPVDLLSEEKVSLKGKQTDISKVKLTDDTIGYVLSGTLADKPVVFIEDTKAHVRNNIGSKIHATIPRGTIGFITGEKAQWIQVYAGKIEGKWISDKWVKTGFTTDETVLLEARQYEDACEKLDKNSSDKEAMEKLTELKDSSASIFKSLAQEKLASFNSDESEENKDSDDSKSNEEPEAGE
jgi:lipoprotein LenA